MKKVLLVLLVIISFTTSSCRRCLRPEKREPKKSKKELAIEFARSFNPGNTPKYYLINQENYKQHSVFMKDGYSGLREVMDIALTDSIKPTTQILRAIEDGNYVMLHTLHKHHKEYVMFHIYEFDKNNKIIEHWDNYAPIYPNNASGHSQIDGPNEINPEEQNRGTLNKFVIKDYTRNILMQQKYKRLPEFFNGDRLVQHSSSYGDGLLNYTRYLRNLQEKGMSIQYKKIHKVLAEGDYVLTVCEGVLNRQHKLALYDLYRLRANHIEEHWEVMEILSDPKYYLNNNGKFNF